jgi:hypothetical protein
LVASSDETADVEHFLLAHFSYGARLPELRSVALVVAHYAGLKRPSRDARRTYARMLRWFAENWQSALPVVRLVELRDEQGRVVDGRREFYDRCAARNPWF